MARSGQKAASPQGVVADSGDQNRSQTDGSGQKRSTPTPAVKPGAAEPQATFQNDACPRVRGTRYRDCISERPCSARPKLWGASAHPDVLPKPKEQPRVQCGGDVTDPGGGILPGPNTSQARAPSGSASSNGLASAGGFRNAGRCRSSMSSMALALASR